MLQNTNTTQLEELRPKYNVMERANIIPALPNDLEQDGFTRGYKKATICKKQAIQDTEGTNDIKKQTNFVYRPPVGVKMKANYRKFVQQWTISDKKT